MSVSMVVMLSGGPRPSDLAAASKRPALDLLVRDSATLLDMWTQRFDALAYTLGVEGDSRLPVKIVHDARSPAPSQPSRTGGRVELSIQVERGEFRGPAGLARDETNHLEDNQTAILLEAARFPACDLAALARVHEERNAEITVAVNPDRSPSGVYAIRRSALTNTPERGFLDLKEQLIGRLIEQGRGVWSFETPAPGCFPIRSLAQLVRAARELALDEPNTALPGRPISGSAQGLRYDSGALTDEATTSVSGAGLGRAEFSVVADDAAVAGSAAVVDSIVMSGCEVGEGAAVVRSLLCPGARIHPGAEVVDAVVTAAS